MARYNKHMAMIPATETQPPEEHNSTNTPGLCERFLGASALRRAFTQAVNSAREIKRGLGMDVYSTPEGAAYLAERDDFDYSVKSEHICS